MSNAAFTPDMRLAVYGSLAPGQSNHDQLAGLGGEWRPGGVRGALISEGLGAAFGYPALILDPAGEWVAVQLFESAELPGHWARLDAFEGGEYRRVLANVETGDGRVHAWIYVAADSSEG